MGDSDALLGPDATAVVGTSSLRFNKLHPDLKEHTACGHQLSTSADGTVRVSDISQRFRAPGLLVFGATTCLIGFACVTVIGVLEFHLRKSNTTLKMEYASGNGYFPSTMSEMVYNQDSPAGKVFHTFGLMSGLCIFMSWYPVHLRNVYTGNALVPIIGVYWTTARQLLPAMGLYLLIGVNTYPAPVAAASTGKTKVACCFLHLAGAGMMFLGYLACEMQCVGMSYNAKGPCASLKHHEKHLRRALAMTILVSFVLFSLLQVTLVVIAHFEHPEKWACCKDTWALMGDSVLDHEGANITIMGSPQIIDTASGMYLKFKIASFLCEDIAGLALVVSQIAVWFFCDERLYCYGDWELEDVRSHAQIEGARSVAAVSAEP